MNGNRYTLFAAIAVLIVAVLFLVVLLRPSGEAHARATVESFGQELKQVSLMAPDAASQIADRYAPYTDPSLLDAWKSDPAHAPGRLTSSPYPDRIEIQSVASQGAGYVVTGEVVEMTSTGEAGRDPVVIQVVPEAHGYRIVAYQEQATE
ncbi:MAG TPA: hypothetical protein VHD38_02930 [Candidatus Paceibacterota bacterium]|nr:hypothetical protein [Candidatus Paceibacterota bacterium]